MFIFKHKVQNSNIATNMQLSIPGCSRLNIQMIYDKKCNSIENAQLKNIVIEFLVYESD